MDTDISRWIMEFIFEKPIPDSMLNSLLQCLPIPKHNNFYLKGALILRKIESEISNGSVSEKILQLLEYFEELEFQQRIDSLVEMKSAYCAVAVECAVKFLDKKCAGNDKGEYYEAVRRIWIRRIDCLEEKLDYNVGVVSDELWEWRDLIKASLFLDEFIDSVITKSEELCAVDAVKAFVRRAKERMGPTSLDCLADLYESNEAFRASVGGVNKQGSCKDNEREVCKENTLPKKKKHVARKHTKRASARTCQGVRITDSIQSGLDAAGEQDDLLPTPEVEGAKAALKLSSLELRALVKDPLPDALKLAETLPSVVRDNVGHQPATDPDLMNGKSAAHTSEQDDSIEDSSQGSPSGKKRVTLPSPKRMATSPLKKYEFKRITERRKPRRRWTNFEEDTLRAGVQKYGVGNWKLILEAYPDVFGETDEFEARSGVNLKDKWRNLTK